MKILIITVSNIGDCILTTGVLDGVLEKFSTSSVDILVGKRAQEVFSSDPRIRKIIPYDKNANFWHKLHLFRNLKKENYDFIFDLRNTFVSFFLSKRTFRSQNLKAHAWIKHNSALRKFYNRDELNKFKPHIIWDKRDQEIVKEINFRDYVVVAPTARSGTKTWPPEYFKKLIALIHKEYPGWRIVITGEKSEYEFCKQFKIDEYVHNFAGRTSIPQLAVIIKNARAVITNDSAVLHIASAVNTSTLAIFGPSDEFKYGPLAENSMVLRRHFPCAPCEKAQCKFGDKRCLTAIKPEFAFHWFKELITKKKTPGTKFKRVLLSRCDKIGDLILTTPAIAAVRYAWPNAYMGFLCNKYTQDILDGNPDVDEIIPLDKNGKHKGIFGFLKLVREIRTRKFEIMINFHPTNRVHLLGFFARIPIRIGYDWKMGFLNDVIIKHKKQLGEKSEAEYNFDLLKTVGIEDKKFPQRIIVSPQEENWVEEEMRSKGLNRFVLIHPGASCISKMWPLDSFITLAEKIMYNFDIQVVFILGPREEYMEEKIIQAFRGKVTVYKNLALKKLIALVSKCSFFISNDSGPMHIADAVRKPLIVIFGRNQPGLSPRRWGPVNKSAVVLWKDVGCKECLAHNCKKGFLCLKAITVDEVFGAFKKQMEKVRI
jgi:heptosyltransferase-2